MRISDWSSDVCSSDLPNPCPTCRMRTIRSTAATEYPHMSNTLKVRKVAVLGAGVMGAQIAAHLVNANVDTVLFDLPAKAGDSNGIVNRAIANLGKLSPSPPAVKSHAAALTAAHYHHHLPLLAVCALII